MTPQGIPAPAPHPDEYDGTPKVGRPRTTWTEETRGAFLAALRRGGSVNAAAGAAGVHEAVVRYHRRHDKAFDDEVRDVLKKLEDELLATLREHAVKGVVVQEVRNNEGQVVIRTRKYSERLLLAWLKRQESGSWADRVTVDAKHAHTGTVQHEHEHRGRIEVEQLTPEQTRLARNFLASLSPSTN